jgi:hypothetical protein
MKIQIVHSKTQQIQAIVAGVSTWGAQKNDDVMCHSDFPIREENILATIQ